MRTALVIAIAACMMFSFPLVTANHQHPLEDDGAFKSGSIRFDHRVGNEWWVEVNVTTTGETPHRVLARSEKGWYHELTLRSWGNWAASFHIPPGERVQFFASHQHPSGKFNQYEQHSCFFTHPAGVEQCSAGSTDPSWFTFRNPSGNDWWEQIYVDSNRPVKGVRLHVDDVNSDSVYLLTKRSWGAWATSVYVPPGSTVWFSATNGAEGDQSDCMRWPQATPTECPPRYGPQPMAPFMTRFDHKAGNEWWVEVEIGPTDGRVRPTSVFARDDGGPWVPLTLRDWGNWAASFHIEPGHKVQFKATFPEDDEPQRTSCWFTHPQGRTPDGGQICRNQEFEDLQ